MRAFASCVVVWALVAIPSGGCGGRDDVDLGGDGGTGGGAGDAGEADATTGGVCSPGKSQCNNCVDDDGDGLVDGYDAECTGAEDDDEGSFATNIPGDNRDEKHQDCFFDGDSGGSCQVDTCCLYADGACPIGDTPVDCAFSQACVDECLPLVPAGCDCFGCCTICNDVDCFDVLANTAVTPDCSAETIGTAACPTCQKFEGCTAAPCDASDTDCILCPGQDPADLPAGCGGANACPGDQTACTPGGSECTDAQYCQGGCCVAANEPQ
jgi:hypothetical protein